MADWGEFSAADFNASLAPKAARRRAARDAETGQGGLFHVATPCVTQAAGDSTGPARLEGETPLFGGDDAE